MMSSIGLFIVALIVFSGGLFAIARLFEALDQRAQPQLNRWHRRKSRMPKQMAAAMPSQSRRVLVMQTLCQVMTVQDHRDAAEQDQGIPFRPISQARA